VQLAKDLIIVRAGTRSLHNSWLDRNAPRPWDLLVCPYEEIPSPSGDGVFVSEIIKPLKWASLKILLKEWQGWRDYRYVLLADDDLFASQATWSRFFECCVHYGVQLAQPALMHGSYFSHGLTMRNTEFVARRVSYVEVMMPCFRADALAQLAETLDLTESGSGWGLDFLWAKRLDYKNLFVVDETPVLHSRPAHSNYPDRIQKYRAELATIVRDNQLPWTLKTFSGFLAGGEEIPENEGTFLYRLFRGYEWLFQQNPKRFEEMARLQLMAGDPYADYLK
jgi:hypothetical protein